MTSKVALKLPDNKPPKRLAKIIPMGIAFLIGGGAIAYLNFAEHAPKSLSPAGTQIVPQTALATVTLTTDELAWTKLRQFGTGQTQTQLDTLLSQWKNQLFADSGYSYKQDIKPWIGDRVTLAVLSAPEADPSSSPAVQGIAAALQDLVLVVPIADPLKARELLAAGPKNSAVSLSERRYKDISIQTITSPSSSAIESAVIGTDWLVLSNTTTGIERTIDTYKGGRSLLDIAGYRRAAARIETPQPPGKNFAQIYLNLPAASQILVPPLTDASPAGVPNARFGQTSSVLPLQGSEGVVATALIEAEGIRFKGASWLLPKNDLAYSELRNEVGDMPQRLPSDTLAMMSGSNLQQFWRSFKESNTSPPFFPNPQNLENGLLTQTGLSLDEDIMPWAAGEFALGLLPPKMGRDSRSAEGSENNTNSEETQTIRRTPLVIMVKTSDRATAESAWSQLDTVMADRYRFAVDTESFEGGSFTQWVSPFEGVQFSHGWLPGNVTFFTIGEGAAAALVAAAQPKPGQALAETPSFVTLTDHALPSNHGHFYIDLAQINALEGNVFPLPARSPDGPTFAIQAIALTATVGDRAMAYDLYVKLAKGEKPEAL